MNLHEYQGKALFAEYGLPVSVGQAVDTPDAAEAAAKAIGGDKWVVKPRFTLVDVEKQVASNLLTHRLRRGLLRRAGWVKTWSPTKLMPTASQSLRFW